MAANEKNPDDGVGCLVFLGIFVVVWFVPWSKLIDLSELSGDPEPHILLHRAAAEDVAILNQNMYFGLALSPERTYSATRNGQRYVAGPLGSRGVGVWCFRGNSIFGANDVARQNNEWGNATPPDKLRQLVDVHFANRLARQMSY